MNDIERLKFVVQDRDYLSEEDFQAIENVLKELETYKKMVDEKNKELNEENLRCSKLAVENNDLKEKLETHKKIAEWLIRYSIEKSINTFAEEKCEYTRKNKHCPNFSEENCIKCIIDWARKEVEK